MPFDDDSWEPWEPNVPSTEVRDYSDQDPDTSIDEGGDKTLTRPALLRTAAGGILIAGSFPSLANALSVAGQQATPRRGGKLRLAIRGTTPAGRDPHKAVTQEEAARTLNLFDTLAELRPDSTVGLRLAELIEPNKRANVWDIRVRKGATFHNGRPVRAEDVIYSLRRILDKATGSTGRSAIISIDPTRLKKMDSRTVRVFLTRRNGDFPFGLTSYPNVIVQQGARNFDSADLVGSGPFKFGSWDVGRQSSFVRNPNYWRSGWPYVDELEIIDIADNNARINALLGGQVDLVQNVASTRAKQLLNSDQVKILLTPNFSARMITMAVDTAPYNDNRVRRALRLATNRKQIIDVAVSGFGRVGNDMYGKGQALYNSKLPQRKYDPDRARALLNQADRAGFKDTYYCSPDPTIGQLFREQMRVIGVNIELAIPTPDDEFTIGPGYLKWPLAQTGYGNTPISSFMDLALTRTAPYNETHWKRPAFEKKLREAQAATDFGLKKEIFWELGKELYDEGGYIQWNHGFAINARANNIRGVSRNSGDFTLGNFDMRTVYFTG